MALGLLMHQHVVEKTLAGDVVRMHGAHTLDGGSLAPTTAGLMARSRAIRRGGTATKMARGYWIVQYGDGGAIFSAQQCVDIRCKG
jgi:hypothetical protein